MGAQEVFSWHFGLRTGLIHKPFQVMKEFAIFMLVPVFDVIAPLPFRDEQACALRKLPTQCYTIIVTAKSLSYIVTVSFAQIYNII